MEVLRSKLSENKTDLPADGLYGANGFFFQQRRGNLDLRGIANINLDKLIREVDVDSLQLHIENITFCNLREDDLRYLTDPQVIKLFKITQLTIEYLLYSQDLFISNLGSLSKKYAAKKKSLAKKRRELEELEETTKHLRNQVKAKKQNISTLEDLLRETSRNKENATPIVENRQEVPVIRPSSNKIKIFVAGPDGLCVEFTQRFDNSIFTLRKEVRQAFISKKDVDSEHSGRRLIKLIHRGKLLVDDQTIEECGIQSGDTVLAVIEVESQPAVSAPISTNTGLKEGGLTEMIEFLSKQQDAMREFAHDIKHGWESALQTLSAGRKEEQSVQQTEQKLLEKMDDKWNRFESGMKSQLEAQLSQCQSLLLAQQQLQSMKQDEVFPSVVVTRRRGHLGELQSDTDDNAPVLQEISSKLTEFGQQLNQLESKSVTTDRSINDLRDTLRERPQIQYVPQPTVIQQAAEPVKPKMKTVTSSSVEKSSLIHFKFNKWNEIIPTSDDRVSAGVQQQQSEVHLDMDMAFDAKPTPQVEIVPQNPPVVVEVPKEVSKPIVVEKKVEAPVATPPVIEKPVRQAATKVTAQKKKIEPVTIEFQRKHNDDLSSHISGADPLSKLSVELAGDLPADEVVFGLRKAVASKIKIPLSRVALCLHNKELMLDLDNDEEPLTLASAKTLAMNGQLTVRLKVGKPLTNAQIDMLVPAWQKATIESENSADEISSKSGKSSIPATPNTDVAETPTTGGLKVFGSKKFRQKRDWDDTEKNEKSDREVYNAMRSSMDEALSGVSDLEGLTDDELQQKMSALKQLTATLPTEYAQHLKSFKGNVVGALTAATLVDNTGSDDMLRHSVNQAQTEGRLTGAASPFSVSSGGSGFNGRTSLSSSIALKDKGGFYGAFDDLGSSGVLRRSVTDYENERDYAGHIYSGEDRDEMTPSLRSFGRDSRGSTPKPFERIENDRRFTKQESKYESKRSSPPTTFERTEEIIREQPRRQDTRREQSSVSTTSKHESVESSGYADSLVYSPTTSMMQQQNTSNPNSSSRAATRYSNESNRGGSGGSGGRYQEADDNDEEEELENDSYIRRPPQKTSKRNTDWAATDERSSPVDKTMLSSIGNASGLVDDHSDDEGDHIQYLRDVGTLSRDRGDESIDLDRTTDSEGVYAFDNDGDYSRDAVGHADIYGHRNRNTNTNVTKARGRLPSDAMLTPERDSPSSRHRIQQRTFSNVSKADSLFRGLPAGGTDDGKSDDGSVNSLALSDSNNYDEVEEFR